MIFQSLVRKTWLPACLGFALALLDGSQLSFAASGSFAPSSSGPAVDQPNSAKTVGTLDAKKVYPLLKTGGPGRNWCKLQLPEGAAWILCSAGTVTGASPADQDANGARPRGPGQGGAATPRAAGEFDYYLLSLSWSPAFCASHPGKAEQCGMEKHFGFVIHGLWPQYDRGGYPNGCQSSESPDATLVEQMLPLMPDHDLINHEWSKHGTCSGLKPKEYFGKATAAYQSLKIPAFLQQPKGPLVTTLAEIEQSFISINPGLSGDMMAVVCKGTVSELRFCFDKQLHLRRCGAGVSDSCPGSATYPPTR